ncbi:phosphoglycolate phosphatase [Undibacterium sp. SXout7W]|uniref:phosphoglycolate phosphatase n=1 Tax=Undibacterium sp. SXout7W TaxID=3413049 RepID=UPI003BF1C787
MSTSIKAVIIDLDGTMLDTAPDFLVAINLMRTDLSLAPLTLDQVTSMVGKGSENLIQKVLAVNFDQTDITLHFDRAMASYQQHYLTINGNHSNAYPGVFEGLESMRDQGLRMACVTNKPLAFAIPLMQKKGLYDYFELIYGGDSFPRKKPDPMPLQQVAQQFDLLPSQIMAIGDSSNDAIAARAAGCPVLTVPYGYNHGEAIQNIESDGIVETLLEAARLLANRNQ